MSQFEFITVAISMVMALGVTRLLDAVGPALRKEARCWIHVGWIAQKFLAHLIWWWTLWSARDFDWNLAMYAAEAADLPTARAMLPALLFSRSTRSRRQPGCVAVCWNKMPATLRQSTTPPRHRHRHRPAALTAAMHRPKTPVTENWRRQPTVQARPSAEC